MIAAVNPSTQYENLTNYILGGKRSAPTDVPQQLAPSARLANAKPTDPIKAPSLIPNSSQKPTRGTNIRIPYARYFFSTPAELDHQQRLKPIGEGDVVFVHKKSCISGHGPNRNIKVTTIAVLNKMLEDHRDGITTLGGASNPRLEWRNVTVLNDFTPDGIVINADLFDADALINVCVSGPTACRNTKDVAACVAEGRAVQEIDPTCTILDNVFVGIFHKKVSGVFTFYYKLFTGRQFVSFQGRNPTAQSDQASAAEPGFFASGPTGLEFANLVVAWRLGKVVDTRLVNDLSHNTHMIGVHVVIQEWNVEKMLQRHGFGEAAKAVQQDDLLDLLLDFQKESDNWSSQRPTEQRKLKTQYLETVKGKKLKNMTPEEFKELKKNPKYKDLLKTMDGQGKKTLLQRLSFIRDKQ